MPFIRLKESFKNSGELHHACLLEGTFADMHDGLFEFLEQDVSFTTNNNPDFHVYEFDSIGIDDTRALQRSAMIKPLGARKIFVFSFKNITTEAQNALLKLFEEPTPHTHFFLITKATDTLLPTLRSRLFILSTGATNVSTQDKQSAIKFLAASKGERLADLKDLLETKDKELFQNFLSSIESDLYGRLEKKNENKTMVRKALGEVLKSKQYIRDRSSSPKLLLEHVALVVPKM